MSNACFKYCSLNGNQRPKSQYTNSNPLPIIFSYPKIPTYQIRANTNINTHGSIEQLIQFSHTYYKSSQFKYPWISFQCYQLKHYSKEDTIIAIYVQNTSKKESIKDIKSSVMSNKGSKFTFLYSHNEKSDLGAVIGFMIDLCTQTGKNVISYDYIGCGRSKGISTETSLLTDIERVIDFAVSTLSVSLNNLVLIGEGIGCIPCIHAGTTKTFSGVKGMILISPQLNRETIRTIGLIESNVFLIHGTKDEIVPQCMSSDLGRTIKQFWSWYPSKGDHYNIISVNRRKFYKKLQIFLDVLHGNKRIMDESNSSVEIETFNINTREMNSSEKKKKKITTISNYIKTNEKNSQDEKEFQKIPSVRMYVMEDSTPIPSIKFSEKNCLSINQKNTLSKKEGEYINDDEDDDQIFELNPDSMNL